MCVGSLVSRVVVLTAAVCVTGPNVYDRRPITVVTGTRYRHPSRGVRVPVVRVLLPKLPEDTDERSYMLQKSVSLLLLQRRIPDIMVEQPLRAVGIDYTGEDRLTGQDECVVVGWHFLYAEDGKLPEQWWRLHRHMRYQILQLGDKTDRACAELVRVYEKTADDLKHVGHVDDVMCFKDPNNTAQPCHGMYGAPLVCAKGRVVGLLTAPSAQWGHCDRMSILVHKLSSQRNKAFLECFETLLQPEYFIKWELFMTKTT
ncbi:uncharacterized protein LOC134675820 [Cydia fagiglandana]|uniref:uncharacterized protein LOC134675820 n=1 Tax=Cydia fagiglandana TaxID=1458189 RepID=UPI002FEE18E5